VLDFTGFRAGFVHIPVGFVSWSFSYAGFALHKTRVVTRFQAHAHASPLCQKLNQAALPNETKPKKQKKTTTTKNNNKRLNADSLG
jgi:hypothetical protein